MTIQLPPQVLEACHLVTLDPMDLMRYRVTDKEVYLVDIRKCQYFIDAARLTKVSVGKGGQKAALLFPRRGRTL